MSIKLTSQEQKAMARENEILIDQIRALYKDPQYRKAVEAIDEGLRRQPPTEPMKMPKFKPVLPVKTTTLEEAVNEAKSFSVNIKITEE